MSKVLVDRELLNSALKTIHGLAPGRFTVEEELRAAVTAQPAEAEGVSNARLMNTLAELARRAPLRTLHTICETQHQVSTVKLERYLEPVGDTLAGYAFTLRIDFDKLSTALSAVTAERDRLREDRDSQQRVCIASMEKVNQLRAEVEGRQVMPEGWGVKRVYPEDGVGFIIESPRANGVSSGAAVWSDAENPAEQMLALILDKVTK